MGIIPGEVGHQHKCIHANPQVAASFWGDNGGFKLVVDFPTGTNEDIFSSSSVYRTSSRLRADSINLHPFPMSIIM